MFWRITRTSAAESSFFSSSSARSKAELPLAAAAPEGGVEVSTLSHDSRACAFEATGPKFPLLPLLGRRLLLMLLLLRIPLRKPRHHTN